MDNVLKITWKRFQMGKNLCKFEFIKNHDEDNNKGYILKVDFEYPKDLHTLHCDLLFLSERMKTKKCNNLVCSLYDKKEYVVDIRTLKQALNHGQKK